MKPVEIEFLMKDNLTGGLDKAGLAVDILQQKAVKAAEDIGRKITDQKGVIRGIETDLRRMESPLRHEARYGPEGTGARCRRLP